MDKTIDLTKGCPNCGNNSCTYLGGEGLPNHCLRCGWDEGDWVVALKSRKDYTINKDKSNKHWLIRASYIPPTYH